MKKMRGGKRAMLNLPGHHSTAAIVFEVQDMREHEVKTYVPAPEVVCQISDCTRSVILEMNVHSDEDYENSLHKIDTIIDVMRAGKRALKAERKLYAQRKAEKPELEDGW